MRPVGLPRAPFTRQRLSAALPPTMPCFSRFNKSAPKGRYGGGVTAPEGYLLGLWLHECRWGCCLG